MARRLRSQRLRQPGVFAISSYTETDKTAAALDLAFATLDRLHKDGLDATSLDSAKRYMLGQFPTTLETNGQLAGKLADLMLYDLGPDDVDGFASRVAAVDATVARATIDRSFPKSTDLAIVLIGDAAKIRDIRSALRPADRDEALGPDVLAGGCAVSNALSALLAGGTGLVGGHCLRALLDEPRYERISS
jgi:hypothetical protein